MTEAIVIIALIAGLAIGTYFVARAPEFWIGLLSHVVKSMVPVLSKRMPPEQEAAWRDCIKRGGEWDHARKRCKKW
jgi:hypothetical protein